MEQWGNQMPSFVRLYCDIPLANAEGNPARTIACVDSLTRWFPRQLNRTSQLSLSVAKAAGLQQLGKYKDLLSYCSAELKKYRKWKFHEEDLEELLRLQRKAQRLAGNSPRQRFLQWADRDMARPIDSLWNEAETSLDSFALTRCAFTLEKWYSPITTEQEATRRLIDSYPDSLDKNELADCLEHYAESLAARGEWGELKKWTQRAEEQFGYQSVSFNHFFHIAATWEERPATATLFKKESVCIPTSYEWPLTIKGRLNRSTPNNIYLNTELFPTLISEETAHNCNAEILPDTLQISTSYGNIGVRPTYLDSLCIGNIQIRHLLVYTTLAENKVQFPFECVMGINELSRLKHVTFYPEKMMVGQTGKATPPTGGKNLYFSPKGGLRLYGHTGEQGLRFSLDFGMPDNVLNTRILPEGYSRDSSFSFRSGQAEMMLSAPVYTRRPSPHTEGIAGFPFLRSFHSMTLDFSRMSLTAEGAQSYQSVRRTFGQSTDPFYLARNASALRAGHLLREDEEIFLSLLLNTGRNRADICAALCKRLREANSPFYNAMTEVEELFEAQSYGEAAQIAARLNSQTPQEGNDTLSTIVSIFEKVNPVRVKNNGKAAVIQLDEQKCFTARVNGKKREARASLFSPYTVISEKNIRKYQVTTLGQAGNTLYGLLPKIEIGQLVFENVPCVIIPAGQAKSILPEKGKGILMGWNTLRHLGSMTISGTQLVLSTDSMPAAQQPSARLFYRDGWKIETRGENVSPTFRLVAEAPHSGGDETVEITGITWPSLPSENRPFSNGGIISLTHLLERSRKITFDFNHFMLYRQP